MTNICKAISAAATAGLIGASAPALAADCAQAAGPQFGPAPQWMQPVAQPPVYQMPPQPGFMAPQPPQFQAPPPGFQAPQYPQFQAPPRPEFQAPQYPQFQAPPRPEFQAPQPPQFQVPPRPEFQAPQRPQFQVPPRPELAPPPAPGYGYPAQPYGPWNDNRRYDSDTEWLNDWFGDWGGLFDGTGRIDMEYELDMSMDWEAQADLDADSDTDFRGDSYYRGYEGYGPYGPYGPWTPYPPAPMMPPVYPAPQAEAPAQLPPEPAAAVSSDDDKDGVLNVGDFCPNTAEGTSVDAFGCAIDEAIVLRGVNFHTDSDKLTDESIAILDGVAETLLAHPELKLEVSGHTDSDGDDAYNKDLSQRRAEQVRKYLGEKGVKVENLTAQGYGEEKPIATNETAEGKAQNRRVELNRL
jgi:OOP family OmpA-OmpF porin